jgi:hypothetical protein
MLSTSKGANVTGGAKRVEVARTTTRAATQRLKALGLEPGAPLAPRAVVMRSAMIGIAAALLALSASAQSAKDIKGPTPLVAIQNEALSKHADLQGNSSW